MDDAPTLTIRGKMDGFGAQLMAMLSGIAYCRAHGMRYVHTPIEHLLPVGTFASDMDDQVESANAFVSRIIAALGLDGDGPVERVEEHLHGTINADPDAYYTPEFTAYLASAYSMPRPEVYAPGATNIAVHVRRGDVAPEQTHRWVALDDVALTMNWLRQRYPGAHFHVFSWKDPCAQLLADDVTIHRSESGKDFLHDFNCFVHADVLVIGASCLSLAAALFNTNEVVAPTKNRDRTNWANHAIPSRWYHDLPAAVARRPLRRVVTVDLVGGLGNTLFTVAAGYAYAKACDVDFVIAEKEFTEGHCSELSPFYPHGWPVYWDTVYRKFEVAPLETEPFHHVHHWDPQAYVPMDELVDGEPHSVCFHGYFQNVRYFDHLRTQLIDLVCEPPAPIGAYLEEKYRLSDYGQVIIIGVRQSGDYAQNGWLLPPSYYRNAFLQFPRESGSKRLVLAIADELAWVAEHLSPHVPGLVVVDERHNDLGLHMSVIQFYLMMRGTDFILSNSTFHWWGAYLAEAETILSPANHRNPYRVKLPARGHYREIASLDTA